MAAGTYCICSDGDEAADVECHGVNGGRHSPMKAGVIGSGNDVDTRNVFVHRGKDQLLSQSRNTF